MELQTHPPAWCPEPESSRPIFVVGAPRSGTSMLRFMLDRHPRIGLCDETHFFYYVYSRRRHFGELSDPENRRRLVQRYLEMKNIRVLNLDLDQLARELQARGRSYRRFFLNLLCRYARENGKSRIGEKSPDHALHVATLLDWYPRCRIVHVARDPRAVVGSLRRMPWARKSVLANARWWLRNNAPPLRIRDRKNYLCVRYEDLVADPERELRRICGHVGEAFDDVMLTPDGEGDHRPWTRRARRRITRTRVDRWEDELSDAQVSLVEHVAGVVMDELGYVRTAEPPSAPRLAAARVGDGVDWVRHTVHTLPRTLYYWLLPTRIAAEEDWIDRWEVPEE